MAETLAELPGLLALEQFAPLQGQDFALQPDAGAAALQVRLIAAQSLPAHPASARPPFSLLFEGPAEPPLPQAIYGLAHPALGPAPLDIFLVPVARAPAGIRYEAVFN